MRYEWRDRNGKRCFVEGNLGADYVRWDVGSGAVGTSLAPEILRLAERVRELEDALHVRIPSLETRVRSTVVVLEETLAALADAAEDLSTSIQDTRHWLEAEKSFGPALAKARELLAKE